MFENKTTSNKNGGFVLVVNAGSSSLKLSLFAANSVLDSEQQAIWKAQIDGRGVESQLKVSAGEKNRQSKIDAADDNALKKVIESIWQGEAAVIPSPEQIAFVGHRVVHGGSKYSTSVVIDETVLADLQSLTELAPEHEAANIRTIRLAKQLLAGAKHIAVFDTSYHHSMPLSSKVYAGPYSWFEELDICRYGFHGINHQYCARKASEMLGSSKRPSSRIITCHLGGGGSLCASLEGQSIMTTMGYTPLEGLIMRARSGSIDPGIVLHLLSEQKYSVDELRRVLNEESGLKGISGLSGDLREIEAAASAGHERAQLAVEMYNKNLAANISALVPLLGGLDALVFSGGVGENSAQVRLHTSELLSFLGVEIDNMLNEEKSDKPREISGKQARVKLFVIPAREDLAVARECWCLGESRYEPGSAGILPAI